MRLLFSFAEIWKQYSQDQLLSFANRYQQSLDVQEIAKMPMKEKKEGGEGSRRQETQIIIHVEAYESRKGWKDK